MATMIATIIECSLLVHWFICFVEQANYRQVILKE